MKWRQENHRRQLVSFSVSSVPERLFSVSTEVFVSFVLFSQCWRSPLLSLFVTEAPAKFSRFGSSSPSVSFLTQTSLSQFLSSLTPSSSLLPGDALCFEGLDVAPLRFGSTWKNASSQSLLSVNLSRISNTEIRSITTIFACNTSRNINDKWVPSTTKT